MVLFEHVLIPVATHDDARATCAALGPHLDTVTRVTAVHVVEKAGGAPDKAPLEKRNQDGHEILAETESLLAGTVDIESEIVYGTDVVEAIFEAATDHGAEAVAFRSRGGSRIKQLLAGDTTNKLVTEPVVPVVSLPVPTEP